MKNILATIFLQKKRVFSSYDILLVLAIAIFLIAFFFSIGYAFGFKDAKTSHGITPSTSDNLVAIKADPNITPYPPDMNSWQSYSGAIQYASYVVKFPNSYTHTSDIDSINTFQDTDGNKVILEPGNGYHPVLNANTRVDGFQASYMPSIKNEIETDTTTIDIGNSNLTAIYTGSTIVKNIYLYKNILSTLVFNLQQQDYTNGLKTISSQLAVITYPSLLLADTTLQDTLNCNGTNETKVIFKDNIVTILLDINSCIKAIAVPISKAIFRSVSNQNYPVVQYTNGENCYLSPESQNMHALIRYPISKWTFAPLATVFHNHTSTICISSKITSVSTSLQKEIYNAADFILANISFIQ